METPKHTPERLQELSILLKAKRQLEQALWQYEDISYKYKDEKVELSYVENDELFTLLM